MLWFCWRSTWAWVADHCHSGRGEGNATELLLRGLAPLSPVSCRSNQASEATFPSARRLARGGVTPGSRNRGGHAHPRNLTRGESSEPAPCPAWRSMGAGERRSSARHWLPRSVPRKGEGRAASSPQTRAGARRCCRCPCSEVPSGSGDAPGCSSAFGSRCRRRPGRAGPARTLSPGGCAPAARGLRSPSRGCGLQPSARPDLPGDALGPRVRGWSAAALVTKSWPSRSQPGHLSATLQASRGSPRAQRGFYLFIYFALSWPPGFPTIAAAARRFGKQQGAGEFGPRRHPARSLSDLPGGCQETTAFARTRERLKEEWSKNFGKLLHLEMLHPVASRGAPRIGVDWGSS